MKQIIWQPERHNWSTTITSTWVPGRARYDGRKILVSGWVTVPENGLTPDCEARDDGTCPCGRSAT
jgi:hypothetical protein